MLRRTAKSIVAMLTVGSLAVALVVSVLAQTHTASASPAPEQAAVPCADHHTPQPADYWSETCATLCDATDFHTFLAASHDRAPLKDQTATVVVYADAPAVSAVPSQTPHVVLGHDPPGSALYLTTRRLRL